MIGRRKMRWTVPCFFFIAGFFVESVYVNKQCREERSINGMALQGFVFKKFSVRAFHECDISCERELTCQSYNYVVGVKSCELNKRTKEARPDYFRSDPARVYLPRFRNRVPLGSIPELAAQSCQEIKASESKETISGKYWLDPSANGTAVFLYCNMSLQVCGPVGVEDRNKIPDFRMTANSKYDRNYYPYYGRLNEIRGDGAWCASSETPRGTDYLQVDMGVVHSVCAVATQGERLSDDWTETYKIHLSTDEGTWSSYKENNTEKVFVGNTDDNTIVKRSLSPSKARFVRFYPLLDHNFPCLRVEIFVLK